MPGTLLVVAAGPLQIPAIEEARRMGLRVAAVDGNPHAPGLALADIYGVIDLRDSASLVEFALNERVSGVMSICTDFAVRPVASVALALGLPGLALAAAENATDKRLMRRNCERYGAPSPPSFEVRNLTEAVEAATLLGYPLAVKAPRSAGSRGVSKVTSERDLAGAVELAVNYEPDGRILIEKWMEGPEVSVEGVCFDESMHVVQVTDKCVFPGNFPVESGHTQPSRLPPESVRSIRQCTIAGVRALGLTNCAFHAEIKLTEEGPRLIEIAARLGGDRIATHLTPLSTGVNLVRAAIDVALGRRPQLDTLWNQGSAIRYFSGVETGVLEALDGVEEVQRMPGLELFFAGSERDGPLRPGFEFKPVHSSLDRYGYLVFSGADAHEAAARADQGVGTVSFRMRRNVGGQSL